MKFKKILTCATAVLLITVMIVAAVAETHVINTASRVYRDASFSSYYIPLPKYTTVNLKGTKNGWAVIEKNGVIGYTNPAHLSAKIDLPPYEELIKNAKRAVINTNTYVYEFPADHCARIQVKAGMEIYLIAVSGQWAMVANAGIVAYMYAAQVTPLGDVTPVPATATPVPTSVPIPTATPAPTTTPVPDVPLTPAVVATNTCVYQYPDPRSATIPVWAGMRINLVKTQGIWAMVENNGVFAFMNAALVIPIGSDPTPTPTPTAVPTAVPTAAPTAVPTAVPTAAPSPTPDMDNAREAVIVRTTNVYVSPSLDAAYVTVPAGMQVNLLETQGDWSLIERNGLFGFVNAADVREVTDDPTPTATAFPEDYFDDPRFTNEQRCFIFLTTTGNLNAAAACGIMANIEKESKFNPELSGSYYGICQWGSGRLDNLKSFCAQNGLSYSSLKGQLYYLMYDLEQSYSSTVLKTLRSVPDTGDGAYEAGHDFCYRYERPSNKEEKSKARGELARDTYFPKYA